MWVTFIILPHHHHFLLLQITKLISYFELRVTMVIELENIPRLVETLEDVGGLYFSFCNNHDSA